MDQSNCPDHAGRFPQMLHNLYNLGLFHWICSATLSLTSWPQLSYKLLGFVKIILLSARMLMVGYLKVTLLASLLNLILPSMSASLAYSLAVIWVFQTKHLKHCQQVRHYFGWLTPISSISISRLITYFVFFLAGAGLFLPPIFLRCITRHVSFPQAGVSFTWLLSGLYLFWNTDNDQILPLLLS